MARFERDGINTPQKGASHHWSSGPEVKNHLTYYSSQFKSLHLSWYGSWSTDVLTHEHKFCLQKLRWEVTHDFKSPESLVVNYPCACDVSWITFGNLNTPFVTTVLVCSQYFGTAISEMKLRRKFNKGDLFSLLFHAVDLKADVVALAQSSFCPRTFKPITHCFFFFRLSYATHLTLCTIEFCVSINNVYLPNDLTLLK